jgi:hypothetical protein
MPRQAFFEKGTTLQPAEEFSPVKGTGFSPYIKCSKMNAGFSP